MSKIFSTSDYSKFKFYEGNRKIFEPHVKKLMKEIKRQNLLSFCPIMVNEDFYVIDGQHRLKAAERLGVPVHYMIGEDLNESCIGSINSNQISWRVVDYIKLYASLGNQDYKRFHDFCEKYDINPTIALKLKEYKSIPFKEGRFKYYTPEEEVSVISAIEKAKEIMELIERKSFIEGKGLIFSKSAFLLPLLAFVNREEVDFNYFKKNFELLMDKFKKCGNKEAYNNLYLEIYNYKKKIRIDE